MKTKKQLRQQLIILSKENDMLRDKYDRMQEKHEDVDPLLIGLLSRCPQHKLGQVVSIMSLIVLGIPHETKVNFG